MAPTQKVTITCSAEDLNAKLSKAQKELGLTHDEYGRLVNAQGEFVGGLSQARVRMGDYIDAQGRMRDAQGHFLDGLSATELKLRMYKDELGNVYTAEGELVRQSEEAARAQEELATAGQRGMQSLMSGAKGAAKMANNLSLMIGVLGGGNEGLTKFGRNVVIATQSFSQFALAMKTLPKFAQGFKLLTAATKGQTLAQTALNLVTGNWVGIAAGALAAGTMAYKALSDATDESKDATEGLRGETDALTAALHRYGKTIEQVSAERAGFMARELTDLEKVEEAQRRYNEAQKAANEQFSKWGSGSKHDELKAIAAEEKKNLANTYASVWAQDTENDPLAELQARAKVYSDVIAKGTLDGEALASAESALAANLKKQDQVRAEQAGLGDLLKEERKPYVPPQTKEDLEARVKAAAKIFGETNESFLKIKNAYEEQFAEVQAELKKKEEEAAAKRADEAAQALGQTGFDHYLRQTDEELERFNKTIETWRANAEAAGVSTGDLETAIQNYTDEFDARRNEKGIADLGLDQYLKEPEQTPLEKYNEVFEKVREAEEKFGLDKEQANRILLSAEEEYSESLRKQAEDAERQKESRLSELGITGLREKRKTEEDKLIEQQTKIAQAVEEGLISTREANDLNNDLMKEYWERFVGEEDGAGTGESEQKAEKVGANSSMTVGSQSLYQALIAQRDDPYKSEVKQRMTELGKTQENTYTKIESLEAAVTGYLERLQEML